MADALKVLNYEGELGIEQIPDIERNWKNLLEKGHSLIINLSRVDGLDLTFIQLVLSTKLALLDKNQSLQIANLVAPCVLDAFVLCGLIPHPRYTGRELDLALDRVLGER